MMILLARARRLRYFAIPFLLAVCGHGLSQERDDIETTRIVSLVPNATEILFEIGAGKLLVGVSDYCRYPAEAAQLPKAGALMNPSIERILLMQPDVVLTYRAQADLRQKLVVTRVASWHGSTDRLAEVYKAIGELGTIAGRQTQAASLTERIKADLDAVSATVPAAEPRPGVVIILSRSPGELSDIYMSSRNSYHGELAEIAGGRNLATEYHAPSMPVSVETLVMLDPEVIIDMSITEGRAGELSVAPPGNPWATLTTVRAVRQSRVHFHPDPHALIPGPSAVATARAFRQFIAPANGSAAP